MPYRPLSEWEEKQIAIGNMKDPRSEEERNDPRGRKWNWDEEKGAEAERAKMLERVIDQNFDELDEMDEEGELRRLREARLAKIAEKARRAKFGELMEIDEPSWTSQVTEVKNIPVVVFLHRSGVDACNVLRPRLVSIARRFMTTKFVSCNADTAIRGYPDEMLPTVIVYHNGDVKGTLARIESMGGVHGNEKDLEWALVGLGALEDSELDEDPRATKERIVRLRKEQRGRVLGEEAGLYGNDADDDDYEDDDEADMYD